MMLHANGLTFCYGSGADAVSDFTAEFRSGEITYLCGPSGSGKTTLCFMLAELLKPIEGSVSFISESSPRATMVLQFAEELFLTESVEEEISLLGDSDSIRRAHESLRQLDFDWQAKSTMHPLTLSFGQARLLAIALQCAQDTLVLILDEPTIGLDEINMRKVASLLKDLLARRKCVIAVTHDPELLESLPGNVMIMQSGRLTWQGASVEFLSSPEKRALAAFE
jgi:energy-coupling factor transport system ATP-binding protein